MKTSNYLIGFAALASFTLVGCSDNDFIGSASNIFSSGKEEITFGSGTKNLTRAGDNLQHAKAAEKLNNHFVLYGFKYNPSELAAATNDELVFDHYNLYYQEGTENTTESNTAGWEYVGYQSSAATAQDQSIKYWDHSANGYVFSAISSLDATATKITDASATTKYDKGWTVSIPAGGTLNGLYASDRVEKLLASDYDKEVMLTFYSVVTKVRFAFYEIIPGYKVHIDKFYYGTSSETTTNFAINGNFRGLNPSEATDLTVTYYDDNPDDDGIENRPKISYTDGDVSQETSKVFGANIQATAAIGTSSPEATYDQAGGEYTCILPYKSGNLSLKVDYTLTSIDGSNEDIVVKGATAVVPEIYTNWKENFAYTYLFKISDNSNGYTGSDGVRGLYPITFDACVVNEEDGIQETITSIAEPSFTTYQNGVIVTENDEYIQGTGVNDAIYYTVMLDGTAQTLNTNTKVYEVNNYGTETLTENVVENWKNNYCVLTEVTPTAATTIPMKNGAKLNPATNTAYYFTPKAGKNYVIQYKVTDNIAYADLAEYKTMTGNSTATEIPTGQYKVKAGDYYKLIRVVGDPDDFDYTLTAAAASQKITAQDGTVTYNLVSGSPADNTPVLGAADIFQIKNGAVDVTAKFDITDNANGTYTIKASDEAIKEGLDATAYSVAVVKKDGTVTDATLDEANYTFAVDMSIADNTATVVAKNSTTVTPKIGGAIVEGAKIVNTIPGLTVKESATEGTYDVIADNSIAVGDHTITIAGETVTITAKSYKFTTTSDPAVDLPSKTLTWTEGADAPTFTTYLYDGTENVTSLATTSKTEAKIDAPTSGKQYTVTARAGGKTQFTYENATLDVTVNKYALTYEGAGDADAKEIEDLTGSTKLIFTLNNVAQVVKSGKIKVYYCSTKAGTYADATGKTYSLVNNGKYFTFGNVVTTGYYKFEYLADDNTTVLGSEIIHVK